MPRWGWTFAAILTLPGCVTLADLSSLGPTNVSTNDVSLNGDDAEAGPVSQESALPEDLRWLDGPNWMPNARGRWAGSLRPIGFRTAPPEYAWRFEPESRPEDVDWDDLRRVASRSTAAGDNATVLLARHDQVADWIDRVRAVALAIEEDPGNGLLSRLPNRSRLFEPDKQRFPPSDDAKGRDVRLRAAAVETWGTLIADRKPSDTGWIEIAELVTAAKAPEIQSTAIVTLGRVLPPTKLRVVDAWLHQDELGDRPIGFRLAVVESMLRYVSEWSDDVHIEDVQRVARLRYDTNAVVRLAVGRLVAITRSPEAIDVLEPQTRDLDIAVRRAAFESLGLLGGSQAEALLREAESHSNPLIRAAVVGGYAALRPGSSFGVDDESAAVRQAAAKAMASRPSARSSHQAVRLCRDPDRMVQAAVVEAMPFWPDELALPVLQVALADSAIIARRAALAQIRDRRGITEPFAVEASQETRVAAIKEWRSRYDLPLRPTISSDAVEHRDHDIAWAFSALSLNPEAEAAWRVLEDLRPPHLEEVERVILQYRADNRTPEWPRLWDEVLPRLRDDFDALSRLKSPDSRQRVEGALKLAAFAGDQTPSRLVMTELPRLLAQEQNALVWRAVIGSLRSHPSSSSHDILLLALNSPWSDVRLMACEVIAAQRDPESAVWLRPLLADGDFAVKLAAIRAAGACGNPTLLDGPDGGLRGLMSERSREVRLEAAAAMAMLGDLSGQQELLRLAHNPDAPTRRIVVDKLKALTAPELIDPVLTLAWTERDPETQSGYLAYLAEMDSRAAEWPARSSYSEKLDFWVSRHEHAE